MFLRPNKGMVLETTKGTIEITNNEYFVIQDKNGREPLVINKEGIQKIEDFFEIQTEIIGEGGVLNNIYVKVRMSTPDGLVVERIGSANDKNLSTAIAKAYPFEMAYKRACATAALEILRKNYTGKEVLPLLYSSFDEFKTEDSINQNVPVMNETSGNTANATETNETPATAETSAETKNSDMVEADGTAVEENPFAKDNTKNKAEESSSEKPVEAEKSAEEKPTKAEEPVKTEEPAEEGNNEGVSNLGAFVIKSNKYRNGITLAELAEKDINYLNWLVKGDNMRGRYQEYQETARKFVEEAGIELPA